MKQLSFENCPKCGAEITKIKIQENVIEYCPNCKGMFVDYNRLKKKDFNFVEGISIKRKDAAALDKLCRR